MCYICHPEALCLHLHQEVGSSETELYILSTCLVSPVSSITFVYSPHNTPHPSASSPSGPRNPKGPQPSKTPQQWKHTVSSTLATEPLYLIYIRRAEIHLKRPCVLSISSGAVSVGLRVTHRTFLCPIKLLMEEHPEYKA